MQMPAGCPPHRVPADLGNHMENKRTPAPLPAPSPESHQGAMAGGADTELSPPSRHCSFAITETAGMSETGSMGMPLVLWKCCHSGLSQTLRFPHTHHHCCCLLSLLGALLEPSSHFCQPGSTRGLPVSLCCPWALPTMRMEHSPDGAQSTPEDTCAGNLFPWEMQLFSLGPPAKLSSSSPLSAAFPASLHGRLHKSPCG